MGVLELEGFLVGGCLKWIEDCSLLLANEVGG